MIEPSGEREAPRSGGGPRSPRLPNRRVLVVEDDYIIADTLCAELEAMGAEVIGPAPDVAAALALIAAEPSIGCAVLDVNLGNEMAWPVADALLARSVPIVLATGYDAATIPARYAGIERCEKPVDLRNLVRALVRAQG